MAAVCVEDTETGGWISSGSRAESQLSCGRSYYSLR